MPTTPMSRETLIAELDQSVRLGEPDRIAKRIQTLLSETFERGAFRLGDPWTRPCDDAYARRLLHRSEELGYTVVVMTWSPGQGTPLHDHAGIWCVEGVAEGRMQVDRYDLREQDGDRLRFECVESTEAGVGSSGSLIPPYEYHVLSNRLPDRHSVTLHVYGGEMDHCRIYRPLEARGWYAPVEKPLTYHEA